MSAASAVDDLTITAEGYELLDSELGQVANARPAQHE
jgi:hypothetical protein